MLASSDKTGSMAPNSRLDAARDQQSESAWYRSPIVLVAGIILFLGAIALVAIGLGGADTAQTATTSQGGGAASPIDVEPIVFGGEGIPEVDAVEFLGDPLPPFVADQPDEAVGTLMPDITATSLANGSSITLTSGRARVIGFFAHWCPHCQDELPELTQWLVDNRLPPNTEFVAVSTATTDTRDNYPPSQWFTDVEFGSPVLVDDADATLLGSAGFSGFPAFIAVDASGVIVARASGNVGTAGLAAMLDNFAS